MAGWVFHKNTALLHASLKKITKSVPKRSCLNVIIIWKKVGWLQPLSPLAPHRWI